MAGTRIKALYTTSQALHKTAARYIDEMIPLMILCLGLTAAVSSSAIPVAPIVGHVDHPRYAFNYAVNDPLTHDNKAQWEARNGDAVKGSYSLVEPDGSLRVVDYAANDHTGFNAVVKKIGPNIHNPIVKIPALRPLVTPINYGFGPAPAAIGLPKPISLGQWSLPWDPLTGSFGGWRPLIGPHIKVISKRYIHGKLHKKITIIPIAGKTVTIRKKHH